LKYNLAIYTERDVNTEKVNVHTELNVWKKECMFAHNGKVMYKYRATFDPESTDIGTVAATLKVLMHPYTTRHIKWITIDPDNGVKEIEDLFKMAETSVKAPEGMDNIQLQLILPVALGLAAILKYETTGIYKLIYEAKNQRIY